MMKILGSLNPQKVIKRVNSIPKCLKSVTLWFSKASSGGGNRMEGCVGMETT